MVVSDNTLLVEGEADRGFFEALCRTLALETRVEVAPPRRFGTERNTKQAVLHALPMLLENLVDNEDGRLAVVVDADHHAHGGGFERTVEQFSDIAAHHGYSLVPAPSQSQAGLVYTHDDGLSDLGLWVMPNNSDEGSLEHWIASCLSEGEQPRYDHACRVIDELPFDPRFKPLRRPKAEVATWLAWQKRPGEGLYNTVEAGLLDNQSPLRAQLCAWLTDIFR